jgi:hypothetical protein
MQEFATVEIGKPLLRDEKLALGLIDPVVRCSVRLIGAVDDWIASHPS